MVETDISDTNTNTDAEDTPCSKRQRTWSHHRIAFTRWNFLGRVCSPRTDWPRERRALDMTEAFENLVIGHRGKSWEIASTCSCETKRPPLYVNVAVDTLLFIQIQIEDRK